MGSTRLRLLSGGLLALGIAVPVVLAVEAAHHPACDRACLVEFANTYIDRSVAHRVSDLPVTPDLKVTENGRPVQLGGGIWKTAKSISSRTFFGDPDAGEAGMFGVVAASDGRHLPVAVRLSIKGQRVATVETVVSTEASAR